MGARESACTGTNDPVTDLRARPLTDDEWADHATFVAHAFLVDPEHIEDGLRELFPGDRFLGIDDGTRLIGGGGIQTRDMTLVGAGPAPVAAVSYVGVAPDARGRGALGTLMRAQLTGLHQTAAEPVAVLLASQAPIYGRYGYGVASRSARLALAGAAPFRPGAPAGDEIRWYDEPTARPMLREVYPRVAGRRVGWLSRAEPNWRWWLSDSPSHRHGSSAYRYAVAHGGDGTVEGYAVFRSSAKWPATGPDYRLDVQDLVAATPQAHVALWRSLLDQDLVGSVRCGIVALDDPLTGLLVNPRAVLTDVRDSLWVRLVDLDRALVARRYAARCGLVLEVTDDVCPWNAGRWRLTVDDTGAAAVEPAAAATPDLACDVADLGAAYLGGTRLAALAAAGRVRELRAGAVLEVSRAFAGDAEPFCPEVF